MKSLVSYFAQLSPAAPGSIEVPIHDSFQGQYQDSFQGPSPVPFRNKTRDIYKEKEIDKQNRGGRKTPNAYTVYQQNFGILKPIVQESFLAWCRDLGDELVIEGITLAVQKGGRTYSYLEFILKEWVQAGVTTLEQAKNYEAQKKRSQSTRFLVQHKSKNKAVLDEFRREMQS
nr:DnaD domain protein [Aquibacillus saliphilus]